jgi:hypothetical protein
VSLLFEPAAEFAPGNLAQRSAALLLHGMSEADRGWAWERLDDLQRQALAPLLRELNELGVPRDAGLLRDVVASTPATSANSPATARQRVAVADADRLADVLATEPAALVRRLLALGPWPWQDTVLTTLRMRRGELFEPVTGEAHAPAPALDEALLARVAERVGAAAPLPAPATGWWHRLRQRVRERAKGVAR